MRSSNKPVCRKQNLNHRIKDFDDIHITHPGQPGKKKKTREFSGHDKLVITIRKRSLYFQDEQ